ncbi:MAG: ArsR/SmtB family transcription factor [Anaerolineales bacterium]
MDELSTTLLDRLIEKTFENMNQEERLAFVERLFSEMSVEGQERFLRRMLRGLSREETEPDRVGAPPADWPGPPFMRRAIQDHSPRDIGPWRTCCRMMMEVDRASQLDALDAARPVRVFGALADETRLKIVKLLAERERSVDEIAALLAIAPSTTSHHLRVLKDAQLIAAEKRGRNMFYSLTEPLADVQVAG